VTCAISLNDSRLIYLFGSMADEVLGLLSFLLCFLCQPVLAFDGGDAAALVIGLVLGILGICACLGAYARKRAGSSI